MNLVVETDRKSLKALHKLDDMVKEVDAIMVRPGDVKTIFAEPNL